ncbi:hypothetical protein IVA73_04145 [Bradyrhizobium sp. 131]|nr:hypothetical protein IVA73_04145 [Bradyrhizobium sp. 131]
MPPAFRNNLLPTGCDNPASNAASSLLCPVAIAFQIYSVHRVLQQKAGLAMAMALVLTAPNVDLQLSSQPPTSGCCDDRLNPPRTALRSTAIIISKVGADKNAMALCRGVLREHGKLIINLTVEDICAMLQMRDEATDHNSVLTDYVDKMLMELEP